MQQYKVENQKKCSGKIFRMILENQEVRFRTQNQWVFRNDVLKSLWILVHKENKQVLEIIGNIEKEVYNIFFQD